MYCTTPKGRNIIRCPGASGCRIMSYAIEILSCSEEWILSRNHEIKLQYCQHISAFLQDSNNFLLSYASFFCLTINTIAHWLCMWPYIHINLKLSVNLKNKPFYNSIYSLHCPYGIHKPNLNLFTRFIICYSEFNFYFLFNN